MTVLDIREEGEGGGGGGGWRFSWTNETLPLQYCPREEVYYLLTCSWTSSGSAGASQEVSSSRCSPHLHLDSNLPSFTMW